MNFEVQTQIVAPKEQVWKAISDIANSANVISAIEEIEVLDRGSDGLIGFRWRETRTMFGKQVEETMWITDAKDCEFYQTRAESHGSIYISRLSVSEAGGTTTLTMSFTGEAQTFAARFMSVVMMPFFKGAIVKALKKDLDDVKNAVEGTKQ